jgi:hypothetical protein
MASNEFTQQKVILTLLRSWLDLEVLEKISTSLAQKFDEQCMAFDKFLRVFHKVGL